VQQEWYSYESRQNEVKSKIPKPKNGMNAKTRTIKVIIARVYIKVLITLLKQALSGLEKTSLCKTKRELEESKT
jgi:hypothetical protein